MIALIVIGAILLLLLLLCLIRLGATASYDGKLSVQLSVGPFKLTPKKKKAAPKEKEKTAEQPDTPPQAKKKRPRPTFSEVQELITTVFAALEKSLRRTCKKLRIDPFTLCLIFGGDDPADVAIAYGNANAILWTVMPKAEELFRIPEPSVHLGMDYEAGKTTASGTVGVSIRIGALLIIALTLALPVLKWYKRFKKAHRNDSQPTEEKKQSEKLTA